MAEVLEVVGTGAVEVLEVEEMAEVLEVVGMGAVEEKVVVAVQVVVTDPCSAVPATSLPK